MTARRLVPVTVSFVFDDVQHTFEAHVDHTRMPDVLAHLQTQHRADEPAVLTLDRIMQHKKAAL